MGALECTQLSRINEDKRNRWMQNGVPIFVIVLNTIWCVHLTRFGLERFAADLPAQDWSWLLNWQTTCNCEHYIKLHDPILVHLDTMTQREAYTTRGVLKDSASPNPHTHKPWPQNKFSKTLQVHPHTHCPPPWQVGKNHEVWKSGRMGSHNISNITILLATLKSMSPRMSATVWFNRKQCLVTLSDLISS